MMPAVEAFAKQIQIGQNTAQQQHGSADNQQPASKRARYAQTDLLVCSNECRSSAVAVLPVSCINIVVLSFLVLRLNAQFPVYILEHICMNLVLSLAAAQYCMCCQERLLYNYNLVTKNMSLVL